MLRAPRWPQGRFPNSYTVVTGIHSPDRVSALTVCPGVTAMTGHP